MEKLYNMITSEYMEYTYIFTFDDLHISLCLKEKKIVGYIMSYINGKIEETKGEQNADYKIILVNSKDIYKQFYAEIKYNKLTYIGKINVHKEGTTVECFECENKKIYRDEEYNFIITIEKSDTHIIYLISNGDEIKSATETIRVFREIIIRHSENTGKIMMHGAAVTKNEGVLVCGDKGSGKTSLMIYLLKNGYKYIANDRVILSKQMHLSYFPLAIRVGVGTIQADRYLYEKVKSTRLERTQFVTCLENASKSEKIELTPNEICKMCETGFQESCKITKVLFPLYDEKYEKVTIGKISKQEAKRILERNCMTPNDTNWLNPWLVNRERTTSEIDANVDKVITSIINQCGLFSVKFGNKLLHCDENIRKQLEDKY